MSGSVKVPDRVKNVAREDFGKAKELAVNAVRSAAYLYPLQVGRQLLDFFKSRID